MRRWSTMPCVTGDSVSFCAACTEPIPLLPLLLSSSSSRSGVSRGRGAASTACVSTVLLLADTANGADKPECTTGCAEAATVAHSSFCLVKVSRLFGSVCCCCECDNVGSAGDSAAGSEERCDWWVVGGELHDEPGCIDR